MGSADAVPEGARTDNARATAAADARVMCLIIFIIILSWAGAAAVRSGARSNDERLRQALLLDAASLLRWPIVTQPSPQGDPPGRPDPERRLRPASPGLVAKGPVIAIR
ncbi:hypothetical protein GCM10010236_09540 [Streptomyces eurythermus]|nr:hypothetical protein GCM10010236_09540 [Streptomyces eurythermus]